MMKENTDIALQKLKEAKLLTPEIKRFISSSTDNREKLADALIALNKEKLLTPDNLELIQASYNIIEMVEALIALNKENLLTPDNLELIKASFRPSILVEALIILNKTNRLTPEKIKEFIQNVPSSEYEVYKLPEALIALNNENLLTPDILELIQASFDIIEMVEALIALNNENLLTPDILELINPKLNKVFFRPIKLAEALIALNKENLLTPDILELIQASYNRIEMIEALIALKNEGLLTPDNLDLIKVSFGPIKLAKALIALNNENLLTPETRKDIRQNPDDFDIASVKALVQLQQRGICLKRISKGIILNKLYILAILNIIDNNYSLSGFKIFGFDFYFKELNFDFYKDIFTFIFTRHKIHGLIAKEEIKKFLQSLEGEIVEDHFMDEGPAIRTIEDIWCCLISHLLPDIKDDFIEFIYSAKDIFLQLIAVAPEEMREFIDNDRLKVILPNFEVRELYDLVRFYPGCRTFLNPEQAEQLTAFEVDIKEEQEKKSARVIQKYRRNRRHATLTNAALFENNHIDTRKNRPYARGLGRLIAPVVGVSDIFPVVTHYGCGQSNFTGVLTDSALRSKACLQGTIHEQGISKDETDKYDETLVSCVPSEANTVKFLQAVHYWKISINLSRLPPELGPKVYFKIYDFYYPQVDLLKYAGENLNFNLIPGKIKLEISGDMQGIKYTFIDLTTNETRTVTVNPSQTVYHGLRGLGNFIVGYLLQIIDQLANVPEDQNLHRHITQYLEGLNAAERKACVINWAKCICNLSEFDFIWQIELDLDFVDAIQYGGQEIKMKDIVDAVATGNIDYLNNVFTSVLQLQAAEFFITGIFKLAVQHQQPEVIAWLHAQPFAKKPTIREKMEHIAAADEAQVMDDIKILVKSLYRSPNFQITKEGDVVIISAKCVRGKRGDGVFHMDLCAVQRALGNKVYMQKDPYDMGSEALEEVKIFLDSQPRDFNTQGHQALDSLKALRDALLTGVLENMLACRQNSQHYQGYGEHHPNTGKGSQWWKYEHRLGDVSIQARVLPNQDIEVKFAQLSEPEFQGSSLSEYRRYLIEYLKQPEGKIFFSRESSDTLIIEGGARLISRAIANQQANNFGIIILDESGNPLLAERFDYETRTSLGLAAAGGNNRNSFAPELLTEAKEFGFKPLQRAITDERIEIIHVDGDKALAIMPYGTYKEDESDPRLSVQANPFRIDTTEFRDGSQKILPFHEMRGKKMRNTRCWELYFAHMEYKLNRLLGTTEFSNLVVKIGSRMTQQDGFLIPDDDFGKIFIESPYPEILAKNLSQMQQILQTHLPKAKIELDGNRIVVDHVSPQMFLQVLDQQLAPNPRYKTPHTCSQRGGPVVALGVMQAGLWQPSCKNVPVNAASQERAQPEVSA